MIRVKVCGTTSVADAELAADLGAWALGLILWPHSKRFVAPDDAAVIAARMRRRAQLVGVFVNQSLDEIAHRVDELSLTHVQLHGDEGPSFCSAVAQRTGARVIKAFRIGSNADVQDTERFHTDLHLFDARVGGQVGGTGRTFDWGLVARRRSRTPLIVAGGLDAGNVGDAIAATTPWAVDVVSGVEAAHGVKDPEKLEAFMAAVAAASPEPEPAPEPAAAAREPRPAPAR